MSVKLGVAPIAWSNDDMPELGGETTLDQCLQEASQAGYIGIESGGKFPKNSSELIPKLNKYNLHLCSGWYGAKLRKNSVDEEKKLKPLEGEIASASFVQNRLVMFNSNIVHRSWGDYGTNFANGRLTINGFCMRR